MTAGLIVMNESGVVIQDITTRLTRVIGSFNLPESPYFTNGSLNIGELATGTPWYALIGQPNTVTALYGVYPPVITISGTTISWSKQADGRVRVYPVRVMYGVY